MVSRVRHSRALLATSAVALTLLAGVLVWPSRADVETAAVRLAKRGPQTALDRNRPSDGRSRRMLSRDTADHPSELEPAPVSQTLPVQQPRAPEPPELTVARVQAFHRWHDEVDRVWIRCRPRGIGHGDRRGIRVVFEPAELVGPGSGGRGLKVTEVAPLEPGPVPPGLRDCFEQLRRLELDMPDGAPEQRFGHQEILNMPWG